MGLVEFSPALLGRWRSYSPAPRVSNEMRTVLDRIESPSGTYGDPLVAGMDHPPSLLTRISAGEEWDAGGEVPQLPEMLAEYFPSSL